MTERTIDERTALDTFAQTLVDADGPGRGCPDPEAIAAFIDGGLDGDEHAAVTAHLADCSDCYALYTETMRFLDDESLGTDESPKTDVDTVSPAEGAVYPFAPGEAATDSARAQPVDEHPGHDPGFWVASASGLLAAALALFLLWPPSALLLPDAIGEALTTATPVATTLVEAGTWRNDRGGPLPSFPTGVSPASGLFRAGVRAVELETALRAGEHELARSRAIAVQGILEDPRFFDEFSLITPGIEAKSFEQLAADLDEHRTASPERVAAAWSSLALLSSHLEEVAPTLYEGLQSGLWTGGCVTAARAGDRIYFTAPAVRAGARRMTRSEHFGDSQRETLRQIERLLVGGVQPEELAPLTRACTTLLSAGGDR